MSTPQQPTGSQLTREAILRALQTLSEELGKRGVTGELCLFGGSVMFLAFTARLSTKDVDAIFQPTPLIRDLARRIGEEPGSPKSGGRNQKPLSKTPQKGRRVEAAPGKIDIMCGKRT